MAATLDDRELECPVPVAAGVGAKLDLEVDADRGDNNVDPLTLERILQFPFLCRPDR